MLRGPGLDLSTLTARGRDFLERFDCVLDMPKTVRTSQTAAYAPEVLKPSQNRAFRGPLAERRRRGRLPRCQRPASDR